MKLHQIRSHIGITRFKQQYFFLSNFFTCRLEWNGRVYKTVEHLFQASKAITEEDHEFIRNAPTPQEAKERGRHIKCRKDWDAMKVDVMRNALMMKFADDKLAERLVNTMNAPLIEGNHWHDNYWGSCTCKMCEGVPKWNVLGALLMEIRIKLNKGGR